MPFIAFLGCDGSGKSAVIEQVRSSLASEGKVVVLGHWRPKALGRSSQNSPGAAEDPHGRAPRGAAASAAKLG